LAFPDYRHRLKARHNETNGPEVHFHAKQNPGFPRRDRSTKLWPTNCSDGTRQLVLGRTTGGVSEDRRDAP
jgi:hypothetical protein